MTSETEIKMKARTVCIDDTKGGLQKFKYSRLYYI
jgi:hypothetical protein